MAECPTEVAGGTANTRIGRPHFDPKLESGDAHCGGDPSSNPPDWPCGRISTHARALVVACNTTPKRDVFILVCKKTKRSEPAWLPGNFLLDPGAKISAIRCACLLYTSDAADDLLCVDLGGR